MLTGPELGRAIDAAITAKGVTKKAVAEHFGVTPPSIQDWVKRGTVSKSRLTELWRYFDGVVGPEHWGLTDYPWRSQSASTALIASQVDGQYTAHQALRVPLLANAGSMGQGNDVEHDDVVVGTLSLSPNWVTRQVRPSTHAALRFIHAYGDSMSPTFEDGDILLVDTGRRDPSGADGVYVLEANDRIFIKRVTERMSGGHIVSSDNPAVKTTQDLNGDTETRVLGRVLWVWNGRKI